MSMEDELVFESFLKKRQKRMKLKWVTYWFRLETSTLCFYSQKPGSSLQLKGQYCIWMVQSVCEAPKEDGKHYAFEINMKNGKKKLLAADTAGLRHTWVGLLWRAMQFPGERHPDPACICLARRRQEGAGLRTSGRGSVRSSGSDGERRELDSRRLRASSEPWTGKILALDPCPRTPPTSAPNPPAHSQSAHGFLPSASFDSSLWRSSLGPQEEEEEDAEEDDYDVLPCRTPVRLILEEEGVYDVPLSNRRATEETLPGYGEIEESIYDVPSSLLRRLSEHGIGVQSERAWPSDSGGVPEAGDSGFRNGAAGWITTPDCGGITDQTTGAVDSAANQGFPQSRGANQGSPYSRSYAFQASRQNSWNRAPMQPGS